MKISVIICCYNSEQRIKPTLHALAKQQVVNFQWEIIVVNNNSSDDTRKIAKSLWSSFESKTPFTIVSEDNPGLSYARKKGVSTANGKYILFCDDDNWLDKNYISTACKIMDNDPQLGALCGYNEPVFEASPPKIVLNNINSYACGTLAKKTIILEDKIAPWGAGMVVRKCFLDKLYNIGFESLLSDRKGKELSSGGDTEICYLIRLSGYTWRYDTTLKLKHHLPKERLNLEYLKLLHYGFGKASAIIEWYYAYGNLKILQNNRPSWSKVYPLQKLYFFKKPYSKIKEEKELERNYRKGYLDQLKKDKLIFKKNRSYALSIIDELLT